MEPPRDGGDTPQESAAADPAQPPQRDGAPRTTNSPPIAAAAAAAAEPDRRTGDHDSLVTVRLSEPPSLHLNTAVPPSTILTRKSPLPDRSDAMGETLEEEEDEDDDDDDDSDSEAFVPATKRRPNLLQELGQAGPDGAGNGGGEDRRRRDSSSSTGSERVDWEELQKKEDLESKGQGSGKVRLRGSPAVVSQN
jgi:hypothetical protein